MKPPSSTAALSAACLLSLAAACGGPSPAQGPEGASGAPSGSTAGSSVAPAGSSGGAGTEAPGTAGATSAGSAGGTPGSSTPGASPPGSSTPGATTSGPGTSGAATVGRVTPTALAADLTALGLDPVKLPRLERLKGDQLRKVMKLFTRSLGVKCSFCHAEDFSAPTPHKRVAEGMWNELTRGMTFASGEPVFCDSCHQGKAEILDRQDKKALGKWMEENYVEPMRLASSGGAMSCAVCHGEPFVPSFVHDWETGKRKPSGPASFGK